MKEKKNSLKKRQIVTMFSLVSFGYLTPSGILLHFGVKNGNGLFSHITMSIHWIASIIFLISVGMHIAINWKPTKKYIFKKSKHSLSKKFIIVLLITSIIVLLIGTHPLRVK